MLKKVYKEDWVAALRSGKYTQVFYSYFGSNDSEGCALGVLAREAGINMEQIEFIHPGHLAHQPFALIGGTYLMAEKIMALNDANKLNFNELADFIETLPLENRPIEEGARLIEEQVLITA